MSSKREEQRNEKIIRGLLKLPPNRRCINCNSVGPQYVCTNFWTFVCITCSGIHREFTHRVKSVSMSKFTSQEVNALQKGGNQRARELFLKAWDLKRNRLPDNSNIDKVREFIKNVYVDKKNSLEESSDRPSRDSQSFRSPEIEARRASSYHSFSQSPPYDFQYEERRYGKHAPALTGKPGSDRGLYEGKLASFMSPTRLSGHANSQSFSNEGSYPRVLDSVSGGGDSFRSDSLSPSSHRNIRSPFSETSRDISSEFPQLQTVVHNSDANSTSNGGRVSHPQGTASSGSFGSFDSSFMSIKSTNSLGLPEYSSKPDHSAVTSIDKSSSFPSVPQSSGSETFGGVDLFSTSFAPQNVTSMLPTGTNSELSKSSLAESVNSIQQSPIFSVPTFTDQQPSQIPQSSTLDLFPASSQQQSAESSNGEAFDVPIRNTGGWAAFDTNQNVVPMDTENAAPAQVQSSDGNILEKYNPFSVHQSSSCQDSAVHDPSASRHTLGHEDLQNVEATINNIHPIQNVQQRNEQAAVLVDSDADKSLGFGVYEVFSHNSNIKALDKSEPPIFSVASNFSMVLNNIPMVATVAGLHSFATNYMPTNPFDLPDDSEMESSKMSQFWDMSSLQAALPNVHTPVSYVGVNQSWFPQNSVPTIAGQATTAHIQNIHAQGPVAPVGGNPFV